MNFVELKKREDLAYAVSQEKTDFTLRIHRAISWGLHAERSEGYDDKFIFYWISFNALYGRISSSDFGEKASMKTFFNKLCGVDTSNAINAALIEVSNPIRVLLDNKYVYTSFWEFYMKTDGASEEHFDKMQRRIKSIAYDTLLNKKEQVETLMCIFDLMYLLRSQIFHGSSTYNGSKNREQVKCSCAILVKLMPLLVELVYDNESADWGAALYPVVNG